MRLCVITLSNLLEFWLCEYVNLVLLWISRMLGMLALQKCQPCSALDFKDAGNKMAEHDSIF